MSEWPSVLKKSLGRLFSGRGFEAGSLEDE